MTPTPEQLEVFGPVEWAAPFLTDPEWDIRNRDRGGNEPLYDVFCRDTIRSHDGVRHWLELYPKPAPGESITRTISLIELGGGLSGFAGLCHGGALLTLIDESLAYPMVANKVGASKRTFTDTDTEWRDMLAAGKPMAERMKGWYVTAKLDIKFLAPVPCPGVIGIETELIESKGRKMKMRAVLKDAKGKPLMQADGLWVSVGGAAKL